MTLFLASMDTAIEKTIACAFAAVRISADISTADVGTVSRVGAAEAGRFGEEGSARRAAAWVALQDAGMGTVCPDSGTWLATGER